MIACFYTCLDCLIFIFWLIPNWSHYCISVYPVVKWVKPHVLKLFTPIYIIILSVILTLHIMRDVWYNWNVYSYIMYDLMIIFKFSVYNRLKAMISACSYMHLTWTVTFLRMMTTLMCLKYAVQIKSWSYEEWNEYEANQPFRPPPPSFPFFNNDNILCVYAHHLGVLSLSVRSTLIHFNIWD